jgi:transposase-like protein
LFYTYLSKAPLVPIIKNKEVHLQIDATYFKQFCLICYQDFGLKYTQLHRFTDNENFEKIKEDLQNLKSLGLNIVSITCDGHPAILKAINAVYKDIPTQRCLVHIQRMCLIWLTSQPKSEPGQELREIVLLINKIKENNDKIEFKKLLKQWHIKYKDYIDQKSLNTETLRYWYTHKMVRRAYITINRALPNMFHYIENPSIPKTTNSIESYFGHLKNHLDIHRGLTKINRINFIKWYIHFNNEKRFFKPN